MSLSLAGLTLWRASSASVRASRSIGLCASTSTTTVLVSHEAVGMVHAAHQYSRMRRMATSPSFHKEADEALEELQVQHAQLLYVHTDMKWP